jgi:purine-binding chemotaxis protein CheW
MNEQPTYEIAQILEQMRADYWNNLEAADQVDAGERSDYLVIGFGPQRIGLPARDCREVLKLPRIVKVPRLPGHLCGIINLRGEIVAVTDLRPLLELPVTEPSAAFRLVVVAAGALRTALLVERVDGLRSIAAAAVAPLAEGATRAAVDLFSGKLDDDDGGFLLLLDPQQLLERPDMLIDQKGGAPLA